MIEQLQRSSSLTGKVVLLGIALAASNLHENGSLRNAWEHPGTALFAGAALGLWITGIVLARMFGKNVLFIRSDRTAMVVVITLVVVKMVIARTLLTW